MLRPLRATLASLAALAVLGLFPLPFYVICGVHGRCDGAWLGAQAGIATVIALAAVAVWIVVAGRAAIGDPDDDQRRAQTAFEAERAAHRRWVAGFRDDPVLSRWMPLASKRLRVTIEEMREWEARFQAVRTNPARAWAAPRLLDGYFMTDLEIDYERDVTMRVTCAHLRPLEDALRESGLRVVAKVPLHVFAHAHIDFARARSRFALGDTVVEDIVPEHPHQAEERYLRCTRCPSSIESFHGPVFPPP